MAAIVPEARFATRGEGRLIRTLRKLLITTQFITNHPLQVSADIVVVGPGSGIVVLEVKDYTKRSILSISNNEWTLNINGKSSIKNAHYPKRDATRSR